MSDSQTSAGQSLREWRRVRKLSQLDLALEADVSARHISFIETGRSLPSREMLLKLAGAMELKATQVNSLLMAAGFALEDSVSSQELHQRVAVQRVMQRIIRNFEPYSAAIINAEFDILTVNRGFGLIEQLLPGMQTKNANLLELMVDPNGFRPIIANWSEVEQFVIARLREIAYSASNPRLLALLAQMTEQQSDAQTLLSGTQTADKSTLYMKVDFEIAGQLLHFYTIILMLGAHTDIAPQDLRIVVTMPVDDKSEAIMQMMFDSMLAAEE